MCLLDALVLVGLVMGLNQEKESPGFGKAILAALGIGLLTTVGAYGIAAAGLGVVGLFALIALVAVVSGAMLWLVFDMPPAKAALGGGIFLAYRVVVTVIYIMLMSPAA